ncbi:MAG: phytanoyl-CoA dioxygenase [Rhodospirillaceae bacterium]|jgi:non-haem Fe2+, alpha-ketoglutarate-dependent halogenase|nr:phytanoyl-CoA dioxygenase [Rhodospirillaceae bacterium]MBT5192007.1 phytanoyl-CoA dioxygenase [Rhodospirillaceae bacterium]MBT5897018.1 phytanoyl-CoA dioxygenase [Rhodospirillaceae bacterium]MBT6426026.1 phytanoyl-CoA dioxygenase [Rhodospirillaceae bacterium]MBT7758924.1 phytanoyl-CoA dioxygenase [Rhodospirillaceae bacterium]
MSHIAVSHSPENESYQKQGYLSPIRVMSAEEAARIADKVAGIEAEHGVEGADILRSNTHFLFPELYDLILSPAILDHVEKVLGPDILCWSSSFFSKSAHDPSFVSWHQDLTYWGLEPEDIVTAWVAITPSTRESGCMKVLPGTHAPGQLSHSDTFAANNLLSRGQVLDVDVDEAEAVDLELQPGEMSLHHVLIVHGSEPNQSDLPRHGFVIRYMPTYCKQIGGRTTALLARGQDSYNHFDPVPRPLADMHPDAVAFRAKSNAVVKGILMDGAKN